MLSVQEICFKAERELREVKSSLNGRWTPSLSVFNYLTPALRADVAEMLNNMSLAELLLKSDIQGASYLVPDKLHSVIINASRLWDFVPSVSAKMILSDKPPTYLDVVKDRSIRASPYASGGRVSYESSDITQVTLNPSRLSVNLGIDNSLVEDSQFDLVEFHAAQTGVALGSMAGEFALEALVSGDDGDGTLNSGVTGNADETRLTQDTTSDVVKSIRGLGDDRFIPDTLLCTSEAWGDSISVHAGLVGWDVQPPTAPFNAKLGILDVLLNNSDQLHALTDADGATFTNCKSLVFDRRNALAATRSFWGAIENYSNPVEDLSGAVITGVQGCATLYNDAIYLLTET